MTVLLFVYNKLPCSIFEAHFILKTCLGSFIHVWREGLCPEKSLVACAVKVFMHKLHTRYRLREHLFTDRASYINKHLQNSEAGRWTSSLDSFSILNQDSTKIQLKIKETLHILWEKLELNHQVQHVNLVCNIKCCVS